MQDSQNQVRSKLSLSIVLSFVIAIFAIFSLVVVGFSQISYAAPTGTVGQSFTMTTDATQFVRGYESATNVAKNFPVPLYYTNDGLPVFCVEHARGTSNGANYSRDGEITDYGLLYLLNMSFANGKSLLSGTCAGNTGSTSCSNQYTEAWATQVAIWVYLSKKYPSDTLHNLEILGENNQPVLTNAQALELIQSVKYISAPDDQYTVTFANPVYSTFLEQHVNKALTLTEEKKLNVAFNGEVAKVEGEDVYQSGELVITGDPAEDLLNYDLTISGIDGAYVVDGSGQKVETLTGISKDTKLYVRIPSDKVTETAQTLTASVKGHFNTLSGHYYTSTGNLQKVVTVTGTTIDVTKATSIEVVGSPDTGMNKAQTIYFIGLIVLLCGVGIVYANAKPVESK